MNINNIEKAKIFLDFNNRFYTLELIGRLKDNNYDDLDVISIPVFDLIAYNQLSYLLSAYCDKLNTRLYLSLNGITYKDSLQKTQRLLNHTQSTDLDKCRMLGNYYKYDTENYRYVLIDIDDMSEYNSILQKLKDKNIKPVDIFDSKQESISSLNAKIRWKLIYLNIITILVEYYYIIMIWRNNYKREWNILPLLNIKIWQ